MIVIELNSRSGQNTLRMASNVDCKWGKKY